MKFFSSAFFSLVITTLLFGGSVLASEEKDNSDWEKVSNLASEVKIVDVVKDESNEMGQQSVYYHELMTGSINISAVAGLNDGQIDVNPLAYPVSAIHANGTTTRSGAVGSSYVHVNLMMNGSTVATNSASSTFSKTVNTTASYYPGTVFPGTEFRARGTHRATVMTRTVMGYTGYILNF